MLSECKEMIKPYWGDLMDFVTLECDGVDYTEELKSYKTNGILVLNIPSYAGGCQPWNVREKVRRKYNKVIIGVLKPKLYVMSS